MPVPSEGSERSCICVLEVIYLCVRGIDFAPFYAISIGFWNCSDSVVFWGGGLGFFFNNAAILLNIILFDVSQRSCSCFGWLHY